MTINADELNTRHSEYLAAVRKATTYYRTREGALNYVKEAQAAYAAWFAEHGVELIFSEEQLPEFLPPELGRGIIVKPWEDYQGRMSYGPSALCYVQSLCYDVMMKHNRPSARALINDIGGADYIINVKPKNFAALIEACHKALA